MQMLTIEEAAKLYRCSRRTIEGRVADAVKEVRAPRSQPRQLKSCPPFHPTHGSSVYLHAMEIFSPSATAGFDRPARGEIDCRG